jgi:hypothetical protein
MMTESQKEELFPLQMVVGGDDLLGSTHGGGFGSLALIAFDLKQK